MPVRQLVPQRPVTYTQLVDRLVSEWQKPDPAVQLPVILEETDRDGALRHVYVVWDAWADLPRGVRGDIIMDAAGRVKRPVQVADITIAMGLTVDEADRYQITWR